MNEMKEDQPRFDVHWLRENVQASEIQSYLHRDNHQGCI